MNKQHKLTNRDISEKYRNYKFTLTISDFAGSMAYWLIAQESSIKINIMPPLRAFVENIEINNFYENSIKAFTYQELESLINEDTLGSIPEILELNNLKPNFYDLCALARNVFYMICREQITQSL